MTAETQRPASYSRIARVLAMVAALMIAGCAARPGPETLLPVSQSAPAADLTVYTATNRTLISTDPPVYGGGRGVMSYEEYALRADAATGEAPGFTVAKRQRFGRATFLDRIAASRRGQGDTVILFVHGYNNSYQEAVFRLASLTAETTQDAVPVLFSWPSEATVTGYVSDRDSSTYARDDLAALISDLVATGSGGRVVVVGHSMGGWLVMEALRQLRQQGRGDVINKIEVGLASPDIDLDVFRAQLRAVGRLSPPITVLVSADDRALAASARVAGGRTRLGAVRVDDPRIQALAQESGLRVIDISSLPASNPSNHDRLLALATAQSAETTASPLRDVRQTGAFVLGGAGRLLTAVAQ